MLRSVPSGSSTLPFLPPFLTRLRLTFPTGLYVALDLARTRAVRHLLPHAHRAFHLPPARAHCRLAMRRPARAPAVSRRFARPYRAQAYCLRTYRCLAWRRATCCGDTRARCDLRLPAAPVSSRALPPPPTYPTATPRRTVPPFATTSRRPYLTTPQTAPSPFSRYLPDKVHFTRCAPRTRRYAHFTPRRLPGRRTRD